MKTYKNLYEQMYDYKNLILAYKKARKGKSKNQDVIEFAENNLLNLWHLSWELKNQTYTPRHLKRFIIKDPKSRVIHSSDFRDRIVHHDLIIFIEPIFDKSFIYDSCANRIGKGTLFAIKRFNLFKRKVTKNFTRNAFCLKADIKHYFEEVSHEILINILGRKIKDEKIIWLIRRILENMPIGMASNDFLSKGMPLGNLTSQFFANLYLNELDQFIKHELKVKYYIRYVDDFVILHNDEEQLDIWKEQINKFLYEKLKLELHPQKSRIILLKRGIDFVGFRHFKHYRLLRKRNINKMKRRIENFSQNKISSEKFSEIWQGWQAYAKQANTFKLRKIFTCSSKARANCSKLLHSQL